MSQLAELELDELDGGQVFAVAQEPAVTTIPLDALPARADKDSCMHPTKCGWPTCAC